MERSKLSAYFGFARRAGKLTLGIQAAAAVKKGVYLLAADEKVSQNSRKEIEKLQRKFSCPLLYFEELGELTGRAGVMLAAVREEHLAAAIASQCAKEQS